MMQLNQLLKAKIIPVLKYSSILFLSYLLTYIVFFYSPLKILAFIPHTPIKIYGLCLMGFTLTILILALKELLKENQNIGLFNLIFSGTAIGFLNELAFHFFLSFTYSSDKLYYFLKGVIITTLFYAFLSFFIAFQLKTKRTDRLIFIIMGLGVLVQAINWLFPELKIL